MNREKINKLLTFKEEQAYLGAYDFYRVAIPGVIIVSLIVHGVNILGTDHQNEGNTPSITFTTFIILGIIAIFSYGIAFRFYVQCNRIDTTPIIPSNMTISQDQSLNEIQLQDNLLGTKKPQKYFCTICKIHCDYRTRHCRKCQVCIERYDHHCFWIGNCVGRHNHRQFYFFLLTQTINNIAIFIIIYLLPEQKGWKYWLKLSGELLALGFCAFTGYLLIYHTMLISCGITTWQHMRRGKITYLKYLPPGYNPFSQGIIKNWINFIKEPTKGNGSQSIQTWQDRVVPFDDVKNLKPAFNIIENEYYSCC